MVPKHGRLEAIELLRFLLAVGVVVYHYYFWAPHAAVIALRPIDGLGLSYLLFCVEAFFVISGFVIVLSAVDRSPVEFLVARTARLAPTLLVASTVTLLMYVGLGVTPRLSSPIAEYLTSITLVPLLRLGHGLDWALWSLSFELRFYLLIFLCMLIFNVERHTVWIGITMLLFDAARVLAGHVTHLPLTAHTNLFGNFGPFFVMGMLLYHRHRGYRCGDIWLGAMICALALASMHATDELARIDDRSLHLGPVSAWQGVLVASAMPVIVTACLHSVHSPVLAALCRAAGRASYPLYVIHQLCGYWLLNFASQRLHLTSDLRLPVLLSAAAASFVFGNTLEPRLIVAYRRGLTFMTRWLVTRSPLRSIMAPLPADVSRD